ncbi:MAG: Asp-tRNA(Asn)/Glu-tRNA(Gln) amidotransferase subunit GatA [Candidatus Babeliales bacterium]
MNSLAFATISELREKLDKKEISPEELLDYYLKRFAKYDNKIGSALQVFDKESILKEAGNGFLSAIPGIIKDNISQKNRKLTCASKILENFVATYDATAVARLKKAGAFLIGRANLDEFAMGSSTETSAFQKTKNPWDLERVPGGSSGGSIAAVAAGFVPWALGSETGGSVRQPAAFCGIVGLKPTYGLVSRNGLVAYGSSLDQIGIATRTVKDNALVLSAIAGHDVKDSSSVFVDKKDYTQLLDGKIKEGLKIGVIENALHAEGVDPEVFEAIETAIKQLENQGAIIKRIQMPILDYAAAVYFVLSRAEAASNLARFDGVRYGMRDKKAKTLADMYANTRHDGFGQEVKARIMTGNYVLSVGHASDFYVNAKKVQRMMHYNFIETFKEVDMLVAPTTPAPAFKFGAFAENKLQMDLQDYFTCAVNIAGIPAISIPCGFTKDKLPIGFQIIGPRLSEARLYQLAYAYEQATPWHKMHPEDFRD